MVTLNELLTQVPSLKEEEGTVLVDTMGVKIGTELWLSHFELLAQIPDDGVWIGPVQKIGTLQVVNPERGYEKVDTFVESAIKYYLTPAGLINAQTLPKYGGALGHCYRSDEADRADYRFRYLVEVLREFQNRMDANPDHALIYILTEIKKERVNNLSSAGYLGLFMGVKDGSCMGYDAVQDNYYKIDPNNKGITTNIENGSFMLFKIIEEEKVEDSKWNRTPEFASPYQYKLKILNSGEEIEVYRFGRYWYDHADEGMIKFRWNHWDVLNHTRDLQTRLEIKTRKSA